MRYIVYIGIVGLLSIFSLNGQTINDLEIEMAFYADVMVNADRPQHRARGAAIFDSLFLQAIHSEKSTEYPFDSLEWISIVIPEDQSFRLFSWLYNDGQSRYGAYLQKQNGDVIPFRDSRPLLGSSERGNFSSDKWYGALYYGIEPFKMGNQEAYILLGFDGHNEVTNKKIADVMVIEDDKVILGAPIFIRKEGKNQEEKSRVIIEFSDSSVGHMKFDRERKILVYDHMVTVFAGGPNMGGVPVPDGSYSAYELKKGKWNFVEKVFHEISKEAPRERPVLDAKGKDIFGKPKKG